MTVGRETPRATPVELTVLARELADLAADLPVLTERIDEQLDRVPAVLTDRPPSQVFVVGDGDSYHAACATELAFSTLGNLPGRPVPAQRFLSYQVDLLTPADRALVVAVSASGRTERVRQAVERARQRGLTTVAITGVGDSPLAAAVDATVTVRPDDPRRSPGIRTYQASLLGLLLLAVRLGTRDDDRRRRLVAEIADLAPALAATEQAVRGAADRFAGQIADAPAVGVLGSGPSEGTARYCAAKLVEGAGVLAFGQDLEEWWHVERFAAPLDMPLLVLAPPGRTHQRAVDLVGRAAALGRRVAVVAPHGDGAFAGLPCTVLPVHGTAREELSPLLYHVSAGHLAAGLARRLGRLPFQGHRATGPARD